MTIDEIIEGVLKAEGGYVNNPNDRGGETNWGITIAVARENSYYGPMSALPRETAKTIYEKQYVVAPGFDKVAALSAEIGAELVDTGVNMGPRVAATFLQRALNVLNNMGSGYKDLLVDGDVGPATLFALKTFLLWRGKRGERVMLKALNCLQGARYIELAEVRAQNEAFVFGWLDHRVA
jgi:lysozyme family protein